MRRQLKAEGAIGTEDHTVKVLRRLDLGQEACRDLLHYAPGRVVGFHKRTAGGFKPGEKWMVRQTNCETVTLERNGKVREFKPFAKGKWDVLVSSAMQISVGDQIRVTAGFREGKNVFKNNDVAQVREVTDTELVLRDGRRMRRDGARIDQGVCITPHAIQRSNHALSLGGAPNGNGSRDGNRALAFTSLERRPENPVVQAPEVFVKCSFQAVDGTKLPLLAVV